MKEFVIADGVRTAVGRPGRTIARFRPVEQGAFAIRVPVDKTCIDSALIRDVVIGL